MYIFHIHVHITVIQPLSGIYGGVKVSQAKLFAKKSLLNGPDPNKEDGREERL